MQMSRVCIGVKNFRLCLVGLFVVFFLFGFFAGCAAKNGETKSVGGKSVNSLKKPRIPVEVARAKEKQLQEILKLTGNIEGKDQVRVYPKVTGKLIEYKVQEGGHIKKGDVIALIDRDITGFKFEPAPVEAPISGIVAKTYLDRGDSVSPRMPIAVVAKMDEVKIKIEVTEVDYPKIKLGQMAKIKVDAYPDKDFKGKISKLSALIDPNTRTATVEITIPNYKRFLVPGMFARINLFVGEHNGIVIPRDAILRLPGTGVYYCFKVEKGKAKKAIIELGIKQGNNQEIKNGVREGDLVILSGQGILHTGTAVAIKNEVERETK